MVSLIQVLDLSMVILNKPKNRKGTLGGPVGEGVPVDPFGDCLETDKKIRLKWVFRLSLESFSKRVKTSRRSIHGTACDCMKQRTLEASKYCWTATILRSSKAIAQKQTSERDISDA